MERDICIRGLKTVEQNYTIAVYATRHYYEQCLANLVLAKGFSPQNVEDCRRSLGEPFLVELFARFEAVLRDFWNRALARTTHPPMKDLLDAIAPKLFMRNDILVNAHLVRDYRNFIVHDRHGVPPQRVELAEARKYLCMYLANFPRTW